MIIEHRFSTRQTPLLLRNSSLNNKVHEMQLRSLTHRGPETPKSKWVEIVEWPLKEFVDDQGMIFPPLANNKADKEGSEMPEKIQLARPSSDGGTDMGMP